MPHQPNNAYGTWLARLRRTREASLAAPSVHAPLPPHASDEAACHVLATDSDGQIAGAVRLFVADRRQGPVDAGLLASFGRIEYPAPELRHSHERALQQWIAAMAHEPVFVYAGGFFTGDRWRGSGLAGALGAAAIAFARLHGSRFSASFATVNGQAPSLFRILGAAPLAAAEGPTLEPFYDARYGLHLQLMAFDSAHPHPSIEPAVEAMRLRLLRTIAMTSAEGPPPDQDRLQGRCVEEHA
jgi:GNAT superfamily N-acetyltransferase